MGAVFSLLAASNEERGAVPGMPQRYMVEVGLKGSSLRIEAKDQTEAIRLSALKVPSARVYWAPWKDLKTAKSRYAALQPSLGIISGQRVR